MASTSPRCLSTAGSALVAAGFLAAVTGGMYGLAALAPGMVVLSVLLVVGYSVAGYLLLARRDAAYPPAAVLSLVLVLATLWVFRPEVAAFIDATFAYWLLFPALAFLLAFAAAHVAAYAFARRNGRVLWPAKGTEAVTSLLTLAALAPVLAAFLLVYRTRSDPFHATSSALVVGGAVLASAVTAWGGVVASIRRHPRFALLGASVGFLAGVAFLFEFASLGRSDVTYLGQLYALAGMLLAGFPLALSIVAWVELEALKRESVPSTGSARKEALRVPAPGGRAP